MADKTALVLRATGAQGRGVTKHLLNAGWTVHAFVSDPDHPRALALKDLGAILVKGSLGEPASVEAAIEGCNFLFFNQMPSPLDDTEQREAVSLLSLAKKASVKHVVHSTTLSLSAPNIGDSVKGSAAAFAVLGKGDVERLVKQSGIPWTIIRPGFFMTNLIPPVVGYMFPELAGGTFVNSYGPDAKLPLIDPDDIGAFVAAAFQDPQRFHEKTISVVGEGAGVEAFVEEIRQASGKEIKIVYRTEQENEVAAKDNPVVAGQRLTVNRGIFWDEEEVKAWGIPLTTFRKFLAKHPDEIVP